MLLSDANFSCLNFTEVRNVQRQMKAVERCEFKITENIRYKRLKAANFWLETLRQQSV